MDMKVLDGPYMDSLVEKLRSLDSVEFVKISRGFFNGFIGG
jgi:hypothetical protein